MIGFPSNEFGGQEPGTDAQINDFVCSRFKATFPLTTKVEVNGANAHPLWAYMKKEKKELFMEAIPITLVLFMESYAIARNLATVKNELHILNANQEMVLKLYIFLIYRSNCPNIISPIC